MKAYKVHETMQYFVSRLPVKLNGVHVVYSDAFIRAQAHADGLRDVGRFVGYCDKPNRTIYLTARVLKMSKQYDDMVTDLIAHEVAHLVVADHGAAFQTIYHQLMPLKTPVDMLLME